MLREFDIAYVASLNRRLRKHVSRNSLFPDSAICRYYKISNRLKLGCTMLEMDFVTETLKAKKYSKQLTDSKGLGSLPYFLNGESCRSRRKMTCILQTWKCFTLNKGRIRPRTVSIFRISKKPNVIQFMSNLQVLMPFQHVSSK